MSSHEERTPVDKIQEMMEEARRIVDDARREARELKHRAREERHREHIRKRDLYRDRKKEKVLNLRIGSDLEEKIKSEAGRLSVPVSTLVRNVLDNAFELVDGITQNVGNLVDDVVGNAEEVRDTFKNLVKGCRNEECAEESESDDGGNPAKPLIEDVSLWQEVTLGKPASCAECDVSIPRWYKAHAGISESTKSTVFLCGSCIGKLRPQV